MPTGRVTHTGMEIQVSEKNGIARVSLEGSLDGKTVTHVGDQMRAVLAANSKLILDLTSVDYLSSAGLRLLLLLYREVSAKQGALVLVGVSDDIRSVMSYTGFVNFFRFAGSQAEAVRALS